MRDGNFKGKSKTDNTSWYFSYIDNGEVKIKKKDTVSL